MATASDFQKLIALILRAQAQRRARAAQASTASGDSGGSLAKSVGKQALKKGLKYGLEQGTGINSLEGLQGYLGMGPSGWSGTTGALMAQGPASTAAAEAALANSVASYLPASAAPMAAPAASTAATAAATEFVPMAGQTAANMAPMAATSAIPVIGAIMAGMGVASQFLAKATDSSHTPQTAKEYIDANMDYLGRAKQAEDQHGKGVIGAFSGYDPTLDNRQTIGKIWDRAALQYPGYDRDTLEQKIRALGYDDPFGSSGF